LLALSLTL
jgi:hypothetical protein